MQDAVAKWLQRQPVAENTLAGRNRPYDARACSFSIRF